MTKEYKTRLTSSHWGTYRVQTENGRITDLINFEYDLITVHVYIE